MKKPHFTSVMYRIETADKEHLKAKAPLPWNFMVLPNTWYQTRERSEAVARLKKFRKDIRKNPEKFYGHPVFRLVKVVETRTVVSV